MVIHDIICYDQIIMIDARFVLKQEGSCTFEFCKNRQLIWQRKTLPEDLTPLRMQRNTMIQPRVKH